MKTKLTKEQSLHLIEIGIAKEKASEKISYGFAGYDPIFTFTDLLAMLPKEIKVPVIDEILEEVDYYIKYRIAFEWNSSAFGQVKPKCLAYYKEVSFIQGGKLCEFKSEEFIDALYELLCWVIENNEEYII